MAQPPIHSTNLGIPPIFSKVFGPIRSGQVGKSSGRADRQVCKKILGKNNMWGLDLEFLLRPVVFLPPPPARAAFSRIATKQVEACQVELLPI